MRAIEAGWFESVVDYNSILLKDKCEGSLCIKENSAEVQSLAFFGFSDIGFESPSSSIFSRITTK